MGMLLSTASTLSCPHGGIVTGIPSAPGVTVDGSPVLLASDSFIVTACAFVLLLLPHPCVTVQWLSADTRSTAGGGATLSSDSVGLCVAADLAVQGPVLIQSTQARGQGT